MKLQTNCRTGWRRLAGVLAAVALIVGVGASPAQAGIVVYEQPPNGEWQTQYHHATDAVPGQYANQRLTDNFALSQTVEITDAHWWGSSDNYAFPDLTNFSDFDVAIYADDGGLPGAVVYSETFAAADTSPAATGDSNPRGGIVYFHSVDFSTPVLLSAGTDYWFSIGSIAVAPGDDTYYWNAADGDDLYAVDVGVNGYWAAVPGIHDFAFQLTAIPEPGSLALLALGGLAVLRRRRA